MNVRHNNILEIITDKKRIEVAKLAQLLDVSQVTVRKDLISLEAEGLIRREHGLALLCSDDDINSRLAYHHESKQKIASAAAELVNDGETLMIESGSCCALLAERLAEAKSDVTVITNSAFISDRLRSYENIKVILLGGNYQKKSQVTVGPVMKLCANSFYVDKLFIGTDGFIPNYGFTGNDDLRVEAVAHMAEQANRVFILTESEKFRRSGIVKLLPFGKINTVVTDCNISAETEALLKNKSISIIKSKETK